MAIDGSRRLGLRPRMMLSITVLLAAILLAAAALVIGNARRAVTQETESTVALAAALLGATLPDGADRTALVERLDRLPDLRHLCLRIVPAGATPSACAESDAADTPRWFVALTAPAAAPRRRLDTVENGPAMFIQADPADEIAEVWSETRGLLGLIVLFYSIALIVVYRSLGRTTGPIVRVSRALADVERGVFERRLPAFDLPEFDRIAQRFNHMAATLERVRADNDQLHRHAMRAQETERARLARELHDELGQSLTAIRADAAGILARGDTLSADVAESAAAIAEVAGHIYDQTRVMMRRLRPPGLDELGLAAALEENVASWRRLCPDVDYRLALRGALEKIGSDLAIHIFRITQEALTNCYRHANPGRVHIDLELAQGEVRLTIEDDGDGFDPATTHTGLGLSGMRERVELLGGVLRLTRSRPRGTRVEVRLPLGRGTEKSGVSPIEANAQVADDLAS